MSAARRERRIWAIVPAAGRGARYAGSLTASGVAPATPTEPPQPATRVARDPELPKQYAALCGATVIEWSLRPLLAEPRIAAVVVALARDDSHWVSVTGRLKSPKINTTIGGATRRDTVMNGLEFLGTQAHPDDWVLVHDAARPCLDAADLSRLIDALRAQDEASPAGESGAARGAVLSAPIVDTVKRETERRVETVSRHGLWRALTPQAFTLASLRGALEDAARAGVEVTDESQAIERVAGHPELIAGSPFNIKVTLAADLVLAERILATKEDASMRVGQGFDVHAFGEGDHVMLGGVRIPHVRGVVAHSDGDVIIHALCDAILGALGDGDIGQHFPDTDMRHRGADSRVFLRTVAARIPEAGYKLINADITLLAQSPRIGAHRAAMAKALAEDLGVDARQINVKATTTERLGFIGRSDGLAALATVLLGA